MTGYVLQSAALLLLRFLSRSFIPPPPQRTNTHAHTHFLSPSTTSTTSTTRPNHDLLCSHLIPLSLTCACHPGVIGATVTVICATTGTKENLTWRAVSPGSGCPASTVGSDAQRQTPCAMPPKQGRQGPHRAGCRTVPMIQLHAAHAPYHWPLSPPLPCFSPVFSVSHCLRMKLHLILHTSLCPL